MSNQVLEDILTCIDYALVTKSIPNRVAEALERLRAKAASDVPLDVTTEIFGDGDKTS